MRKTNIFNEMHRKKEYKMDHNIQKYMAFVKTVETGSFTKIAEELNYTQSSVSKMIADLEKEWNLVLLERDRNGVHLTASGEQILPYARMLIEDYRKLQEHVDGMNGIQEGTIRIGTFSSVAINWLPAVFERFQRDYPGIRYEMLLGDYEEVENWIEDGRVDCGFLSLPVKRDFDTLSLKMDEYLVVLPKGHRLTEKEKVDIGMLEKEPFMLLEHGGRTEVTDLLEKYQVHPDIRFTTWEDYAIMAMVERGLGISILPQMILRRIPYEIEIRSLEKPYYREIGIAVKNRKRMSPATMKFFEYLKYRES